MVFLFSFLKLELNSIQMNCVLFRLLTTSIFGLIFAIILLMCNTVFIVPIVSKNSTFKVYPTGLDTEHTHKYEFKILGMRFC